MEIKSAHLKLTEIKEVSDLTEVNNLLRSGWVYLGFHVRVGGGDFEDQSNSQIPVYSLGDPDPDQSL